MRSQRSYYHSVVCGFVLIIAYIPEIWTQADFQVPQSPCPEIFIYRSNGYEYYGYGQLKNHPIGQDIVMMANLIVPATLLGNYFGKLQLVGSPEQISYAINSNLAVNFEILFPTQNPLPLISSITVNDRIICENSNIPLFYGQRTKVTLQYTFRPDGLQSYPSQKPIENSVQPNIEGLSGNVMVQATDQEIPIQIPNVIVQTTIPTTTPTTTPATISQSPIPANSFSVGCGKIPQSVTALAFGGSTINKGDWPWLAAIHYYKTNSLSFRCAGTIISKMAVLSAAHCFYSSERKIRAEDITIFLGHHNLKQLQERGTKIVNVGSLAIHPDYKPDGKFYSDIAIAKFTEAIEFSEIIQPVCLWSGSTDINEVVGQIGVVVGWGRDENGNPVTPEPKKVQLPIVSDVNCLRSNEAFAKITNERTFCAGWRNGTDGPCSGDSGTGMMLNRDGIWYIRGVVSSSLIDPETSTCNLYEYVVFTDVAKFSSWIESNMS